MVAIRYARVMRDCLLCARDHSGGPELCPDSRVGQTVAGKYRVEGMVGCGGIAAVYAAHHVPLRRDIALKVIHTRFAKDRELTARFLREARETAAIGHPAFVAVHDTGATEDGCAFIEMDRLEGQDLYSIRKDAGPLPPPRVVAIAIAVLDALDALHARGVIHRDLKSANIYVEAGSERVRLLDLGFAKANDGVAMTDPDQLLGTPFYISPEQYLDPSDVDARADLFSLGIVMFELLTGEWPYHWDSKRELLKHVMNGELTRNPAARRPDVPPWLDAIVAKALAHDRADRFASAADMRAALERGGERPGLLRRLLRRATEH